LLLTRLCQLGAVFRDFDLVRAGKFLVFNVSLCAGGCSEDLPS